MNAVSLLVGRVLMAQMFLLAGISKINAYSGTGAYMEAMGVSASLLPLVIALEIGVGLALIIGWQIRWAAYSLAAFTLVAAVMFHFNPDDPMQMILFMKNIAIVGGLFVLSTSGSGVLSVDAWRRRTSTD